MVVYLDEAGNSGCLTKSGKVSYRGDNQPLYVLAAVMSHPHGAGIIGRYQKFKEKHGYGDKEMKGSDLLTKRNNAVLADFIDEFVGKCPVELCVYSKDFYLATALMQSALGPDAKSVFPIEYYSDASDLALFGQEAIDAYAEYSSDPTEEAAEKLVKRLLDKGAVRKEGLFWAYLEEVERTGSFSTAFDRGVVSGDYERPAYQNLVNLAAFGELMLAIKPSYDLSNADMRIIHDHIFEFENEYISALSSERVGFRLTFEESSNALGIQLADNMASIVFGAAKRTIKAFKSQRLWSSEGEWSSRLWSKLFFGIGPDRFKLVVPLQDQALLFAVAEMYQDGFPEEGRGASCFDGLYLKWLCFVCGSQLDLVASYDSRATKSLMAR